MNKRLPLLLAVLILLTLLPSIGMSVQAQDAQIKLGMSTLNLANPFFVELVAGAQAKADELGIELVVSDSGDDPNKQVSDLENYIAGGFNGIIVTAVDPQAIAPVAREALDEGLAVVAHTSDLGADNQSALVWAEEFDMGLTLGRQAGAWANDHIAEGETLELAILNFDIIPQVIQRREGIVAGIEEVFAGEFEVRATATAGDPTAGLEAAETWLQAYPSLDMIVGINDGGALGAYQAVIAADKNDPAAFFVGGIDATDEALATIAEGGSYQATVDQQPFEMGALCVEAAMAAINGEDFPAVTAIQLAPVNASNLDEFLGADMEAEVEGDPLLAHDFMGVKIGMSTLNLANPFFVELVAGAQSESDKFGVELVVSDSGDDPNKQVSDLENYIAGGFNGIIVTAVDPQAIAPVANEALEAGLAVVAHTSDLGADNQSALVWAEEFDMGLTLGRQAGAWANDHIAEGETLELAILNFDIIPQVIQRREGIVAGIAEVFEGEFEVRATATAGDPTAGLEAAETWLQAFPGLDMIVGINDGGALGAYQAVIAADKNDPATFFVGGIDATDEALATIAEGGVYQASVDQQPFEMGALTVRGVLSTIAGLDFPAVSAIELAPVNASNLADFME